LAKKITKFHIVLLSILVIVLIYYSTYRGIVLSNTAITEIDSITEFTSGGPQTLVTGRDKADDKKAVWLFKRNIQGVAYLKNMISKEDARLIAVDHGLIDEDLFLELRYFENPTDVLERVGPYWVARDRGSILVYIDPYTGDSTLRNTGPVD